MAKARTAPVSKFPPRLREVAKTCAKCGETKPIGEFYRDASKSTGRRWLCKACDRAHAKAYYSANREQQLARANERNRRKRATAK